MRLQSDHDVGGFSLVILIGRLLICIYSLQEASRYQNITHRSYLSKILNLQILVLPVNGNPSPVSRLPRGTITRPMTSYLPPRQPSKDAVRLQSSHAQALPPRTEPGEDGRLLGGHPHPRIPQDHPSSARGNEDVEHRTGCTPRFFSQAMWHPYLD